MSNLQIKVLANIGFILILLSVLNKVGIKLDWAILSGVPIIVPQLVNWIDTAVYKKSNSIREIEEKYKIKDAEQDNALKQALNLGYRTELNLNQLTKFQSMSDRINEYHAELTTLKGIIKQLDLALKTESETQKSFKQDFMIWFEKTQGRAWRS